MTVTLRPSKMKDLELMLAWRSDEDVYRHFKRQTDPLNWEDHVSWFVSRSPERYDWIIEYQGRRVGLVYVSADGEIGIYIGEKSLWGEGVGTIALSKACGKTDQTLSATIHESNTGSQSLFERVGFDRIGKDGEWTIYEMPANDE